MTIWGGGIKRPYHTSLGPAHHTWMVFDPKFSSTIEGFTRDLEVLACYLGISLETFNLKYLKKLKGSGS